MQLTSVNIDHIRLIMHCEIRVVFSFLVIDWLLGTFRNIGYVCCDHAFGMITWTLCV